MSLILASEMGVNCKITAAPALERPRDIIGLLVSLQAGDILFIDEIHRLNRVTEELLYPAMEDNRLDVTIGKGQSAKIRSIPLKTLHPHRCHHQNRFINFPPARSFWLDSKVTILSTR